MSASEVDGSFVRLCPGCGAEFVSTVEVCYDCGTALETRPADEFARPAAATADAAAATAGSDPPPGWVPVQTAELDWAVELAERLRAAGIAARFARDCKQGCRPSLSVFVAPGDAAAALEVARALYVEKVPDAAGLASLEPPAADRCPACGEAVGEQATHCPDCGLALVQPDPA